MSDINDATEAQREAKDLRYLRHPRIVRYVDDFLHASITSVLAYPASDVALCVRAPEGADCLPCTRARAHSISRTACSCHNVFTPRALA